MSLEIVATPIGHPLDLTERAKRSLREAEFLIGEERSVLSRLLKKANIDRDPDHLRLLNEHSSPQDVQDLLQLCQKHRVALVSDAGTPGFCDPGPQLVQLCRKEGVQITSLPGPSSLTCLISLTSRPLRHFVFHGFLPAERDARAQKLQELEKEQKNKVHTIILMDTPYRMGKLLNELSVIWPQRHALIGLDLTQSTEEIHEASILDLHKKLAGRKAEFIMLIY